jgi:NADPH:quinone reductase-like Zn-dependent oxidoreductase
VRAVVFTGAGGAEVVSIEERPDPVPASHEVLIEVQYAGLNPSDIAQRAGTYPAPPGSVADVPGLEVAGRVIACGASVTEWRAGDRVFGIVGGGGLANRVVAHERHLARVPEGLSEHEAAAAPETFVTAHDALFTQCGLTAGDVVLVNGANGGVGLAAVQLGLAAHAKVVAHVRTADSATRVAELGRVTTATTPDEAIATTKALGRADIILELVGGTNIALDFAVVAPKGQILLLGVGTGARAEVPLGRLMTSRVVFRGSVLRSRPLEEKVAAIQAFAHAVVPLLADGTLTAIVDSVFPADKIVDAFDHLEQPGKFGKILIEF